ncbi:MAG TPA: c-type cytochrome [Sulfurimonas sp.]|nr:c-type cytochrome [Sulfurimonas sp.]
MKKIILGLTLISTMILAADGASLYSKCAGCHGSQGEKKALGKSKIIQDMTKMDLVATLNGYKDGSYGGAMKGIMRSQIVRLSTEDIEALALHITTLKNK